MNKPAQRQILIAGAGDIGTALARQLAQRGDEVLTLRRRAVEPQAGIHHLRADLTDSSSFTQVPRQMQVLVFCAAPDQRSEAAYRALYVDGTRRLLDRIQIERVLWVSSTSVYAEDAGEWVDENTPACAETFNGRVLRQAEIELMQHADPAILRFSGLYGPGRDGMLRRARAGEANRMRWSNRLHVEDAVASLAHALDTPSLRGIHLASDDRPALESSISAWLRERENLPPLPAPDAVVSGRRIRNTRLRETGWAPLHVDFRSGYAAME